MSWPLRQEMHARRVIKSVRARVDAGEVLACEQPTWKEAQDQALVLICEQPHASTTGVSNDPNDPVPRRFVATWGEKRNEP